MAARSVSTAELVFQLILLLGVVFFVWQTMADGIVKLSQLFRPSHRTENKILNLHVDSDQIHEQSGYVAETVRQKMEFLEGKASDRGLGK